MCKVFEDLFMDLQADMIYACMNYVNGEADKIYVYASSENGVNMCFPFYEINHNILKPGDINKISVKYDVSLEKQEECLEVLFEDLEDLIALCKEHNRPMPTEIKIVYDVKKNSLDVNYKYNPVYSNHPTKDAHDVLDEWYNEVINSKQD